MSYVEIIPFFKEREEEFRFVYKKEEILTFVSIFIKNLQKT